MNFFGIIITLAIIVWFGFEIYGLVKSIKRRRELKNNQKVESKADNNDKEKLESE